MQRTMSSIRNIKTFRKRLTPIWTTTRMCFVVRLCCYLATTRNGATLQSFLPRTLNCWVWRNWFPPAMLLKARSTRYRISQRYLRLRSRTSITTRVRRTARYSYWQMMLQVMDVSTLKICNGNTWRVMVISVARKYENCATRQILLWQIHRSRCLGNLWHGW